MRYLYLTTLALVLLGSATSFAQVASSFGNTTTTTVPVATSTSSVPTPGTPLGAIQLNLGTPISASGLGSISTCPATGITSTASNFPVDATDPTGAGASQFGTSAMSCGTPSPPSGPGIVTGSAFSDGAIPLGATEAGGSGMSPLVAVPPPAVSAASCSGGLTMLEAPSLPTPYDSAGAAGASSSSGC